MTSPDLKAFDFALEVTKQLLTLAVAVITVSIAFNKDFVGTAPDGVKVTFAFSWATFLASVVFGAWTMMALTGTLSANRQTIEGSNVRIPAVLQVCTFAVGLLLTTIAGILAL